MDIPINEFIALFVLVAGFVIGIGSVLVIDLIGLLGRKSTYWTNTAIRAHKVTKPLIWVGMTFLALGGWLWYRNMPVDTIRILQIVGYGVLLVNGSLLSFVIAPFLVKREQQGKAHALLPAAWQFKIGILAVISALFWWGELALFVVTLIMI